jgi:glycosyltransferase involved in cell wall biosynthesis
MTRNGKNPKVVHLTSVHAPTDVRIISKECGTLAEAGYDVVVIAAGKSSQVPNGVVLRSLPEPHNRRQRLTKTIWQVYRAARRERAAVYHFHDPELMFVGLVLRLLGARVVFDVHEDIPADIVDKYWIPSWMRRPIAAAVAILLGLLNRSYSAIVAATPSIAKRFRNKKTVIVSNYPRIEEFSSVSPVDFSDRRPSALYLGSITVLRCIDLVMSALASAELDPAIRMVLAGRFENEALEARMRSLPGWSRVDFVGWCGREEVSSLLSRSCVGLLLFRPADNHKDSMPTKLFEYMAAGLPVIISNTIRLSRELEREGCVVVVDPLDIDSIARAINNVVLRPEAAREMGLRGRQLVYSQFQWATEATKLKRLYAEIT